MKKKSIILLATACLTTIGIIGSMGVMKFNISRASGNTPHNIQLNDTNRPTVSRGKATSAIPTTSGNASLTYYNVISNTDSGKHVKLLKGGYIKKSDSSKALDYVTATFSEGGKLRLYTGYTAADQFSYELTSGIKQKVVGNYFKVLAEEITDLETLDVCYGCSAAQSSSTMLNGKDFFDGNNWYTCAMTGNTEQGTVIGSAILDNGQLRFHKGATDAAPSVVGHIDLFRGSENLFLYNTKSNVGMYKNFTVAPYIDEFNTFNGIEHTYTFGIKAAHSFYMLVGGGVQAGLSPSMVTGDGKYLGTYLHFDLPNKKVKINQGSTSSEALSNKFEGSMSFTSDGSTENQVTISLTRENTDSPFTRAGDKLTLKVYVNGTKLNFVESSSWTKNGACCDVDANNDFTLSGRLFENTQYGPYFGIRPIVPSGAPDPTEYDILISSFSWSRAQLEEMPIYGVLDATTFVDGESANQGKNFSNYEIMKSYRYSPKFIDGYLRFSMTDIWNDFSTTTRDKSNAKLHLILHCNEEDDYGTPADGDFGFLLFKSNTYTDRSLINWDETALTWKNRPDGLKQGDFVPRNTYRTYTYNSSTDILEVIMPLDSSSFSHEEFTRYIDKQSPDNLFTMIAEGKTSSFELRFYSITADPAKRPVIYLTY